MNMIITLTTVAASAGAGASFNFVKVLIISLVIGLIVGLIYAASLKGQLTSVYKNDTAADYTIKNSMKVDSRRDLFLYSKTEKQAKPQQSAPQGK